MLAVGDKAGETATFAAKFNKFFDCLNVTSYTEGRQSRNPNRCPYRSPGDTRLTVMHI